MQNVQLTLRNELHAERTRADDADRDLKEVVIRFKALYQEKATAVQEAAKAKQELQYVDCSSL